MDLGLDLDLETDMGGDDECLTIDDLKNNSSNANSQVNLGKVEEGMSNNYSNSNSNSKDSRGFIKRFIIPVVLALGAFIVAANPVTAKLLSKIKKFNNELTLPSPADDLLSTDEATGKTISLGVNSIGFAIQGLIFLIIFVILNTIFG